MNAPPFPLNPEVGEWFGNWIWNGSRWVASRGGGMRVFLTVFDANGTFPYMPRGGLMSVMVECVGAGGGGGGAQGELLGPPTSISGWMLSGGGGAAGAYAQSIFPPALVMGGVLVNVGLGGPGGPPTYGQQAGIGGNTSFGALVTAIGGQGGFANVWNGTNFSGGEGGARGPLGTGQFLAYGNAGEHGQSIMYSFGVGQVIVFGGRGGGSHFQSSELGVSQSPTGSNGGAGFYGAGGGGAASPYASGPASGGPGGDGVCRITEYCWVDGADDCFNMDPINVNARVTFADDCKPGPGKPGPGRPRIGPFDGDWDDGAG